MTEIDPTTTPSTKTGWKDISSSLQTVSSGMKADIPPHWRQGRTAYGGLTAALMLYATQTEFPDLPPLRSALINFVGPVTDSPVLKSKLNRKGRNVTNISATAKVGDNDVGRADFLFGSSRASKIKVGSPAPPAKSPEDYEPFTPDAAHDFVPSFFHNFDTRLIAGGRPMAGDKGYIRTWSRHKDAASRNGIASLLCIGDVLPPAAMPLMRELAPVSSMSWIFNLLTETPETENGWWHIESDLTAARGGYSSQVMRIWNSDGQLVVEGLQSIAIFDG